MAGPRRRWSTRAALLATALLASALLLSGPALAIDNPDVPDRSAEFLARAQPFEERLSQATGGSSLGAAAAAYATFLDAELNQAYGQLLKTVGNEPRRGLQRAQRQWLAFRDAESQFIERNWTPQNFGSSATLSRADYRASLVKQRVLMLIAYLQNYAAGTR